MRWACPSGSWGPARVDGLLLLQAACCYRWLAHVRWALVFRCAFNRRPASALAGVLLTALARTFRDVWVALANAVLTASLHLAPRTVGPISAEDSARIDADIERARHIHSCLHAVNRRLATAGCGMGFFVVASRRCTGATVASGWSSRVGGRLAGAPPCTPDIGATTRVEAFRPRSASIYCGRRTGHAVRAGGPHVWLLGCGRVLAEDRCFTLTCLGWVLSATERASCRMLRGWLFAVRNWEGKHDWTIFVVAGRAAAVVANCRISIRWDAETKRATGGLKTRPDFIAMPRDEQGRPIIQRTPVTTLVKARVAWESEVARLTRSLQPLPSCRAQTSDAQGRAPVATSISA